MHSLVENKERDVLLINGQEFNGFIDDVGCQKCAHLRIYSFEYDAYFFFFFNEWLEEACNDASCEFLRKGH